MSTSNGRGSQQPREVDAGGANRSNTAGNGNKSNQQKQTTNSQNPFSKPLPGLEEVKQPAGGLPASKKNSEPVNCSIHTRADLRLLVLSDTTASFYSTESNAPANKDKATPEVWLK